jgi:hypothetical protein
MRGSHSVRQQKSVCQVEEIQADGAKQQVLTEKGRTEREQTQLLGKMHGLECPARSFQPRRDDAGGIAVPVAPLSAPFKPCYPAL